MVVTQKWTSKGDVQRKKYAVRVEGVLEAGVTEFGKQWAESVQQVCVSFAWQIGCSEEELKGKIQKKFEKKLAAPDAACDAAWLAACAAD